MKHHYNKRKEDFFLCDPKLETVHVKGKTVLQKFHLFEGVWHLCRRGMSDTKEKESWLKKKKSQFS